MAKKKPPKVSRSGDGVEYKLLIDHFNDPLSARSGVLFLFRTSEEFQNFVYDLVVETSVQDRKIYFRIVGLKTPLTGFPSAGPAICRCEIEDLEPGVYTILIDRRSKQTNQFKVSIRKKIRIIQSARQRRFIDVTVDSGEWSEG